MAIQARTLHPPVSTRQGRHGCPSFPATSSCALALRPVGSYLARLNDDSTADALRIIEPTEDMAKLIERNQARDARSARPAKPIAQARTQAAASRTPPALPKEESLYAGTGDALAVERGWTQGEWTLTGPLNSGAWVIYCDGKIIASISAADVSPAAAEANARAMVRARQLTGCLSISKRN
jgi:hypothetical protein